MSNIRPCLSCFADNPLDTSICRQCGVELRAFARASGVGVRAASVVSAAVRRGVVVAVLAGVLVALGALALQVGWRTPRSTGGPTWRRPDSVEGWARQALEKSGLSVRSVRAILATNTPLPRRLLAVETEGRHEAARAVRAISKFLLEARSGGERTAFHAVRLDHGGSFSLTVSIGEARRLAEDAQALDAWLDAHGISEEDRGPHDDEAAEAESDGAPPSQPEAVAAVPPPGDSLDEPAEAVTQAPEAVTEAPDTAPPTTSEDALLELEATPPGDASQAPAPDVAAPRPPGRPPTPVRVLRGTGAPHPSATPAGTSGLVVLRAQVHPSARRELVLEAFSVAVTGTASEVDDISEVRLVRDLDRNGVVDGADPQLGSAQSFDQDNGTLTWTGLDVAFGADGSPVYLLAVMDLSPGGAGSSGTLSVTAPRDPPAMIREVSSGQPCPVAGTPLQGATFVLTPAEAPAEPVEEVEEEQPSESKGEEP